MLNLAISSQTHYPERFIVFIDILAFTQDVLSIEARPGVYLSVDAVLNRIANCKANIDGKRSMGTIQHDARMTHFSDCLVMSFSMEEGAAFHAIKDAAFLAHAILCGGYLARGAITVGPLRHDDNVVFGKGLIEAYKAERDDAIMPRIIIAPSVIAKLHDSTASKFVRDKDSCPFLHVLSEQWPFVAQVESDYPGNFREMFEEIAAVLPIRFSNANGNTKAQAKIRWMRNYFNESLDEIGRWSDLKVELPS